MQPLDTDNPELRVAVFGRQVENFLDSDIGRYLQQCASIEIDEGLDKLKSVDPDDPVAIRKAQNRVVIAESVIGWLLDAVNRGHQSVEVLKGED